MKAVLGLLARWVVLILLLGVAGRAMMYGRVDLARVPDFIIGQALLLAILAVPLAFFAWRTLVVIWIGVFAAMLGATLVGWPLALAAPAGLFVMLLLILARQLLHRWAPTVRMRDEKGRYVELSLMERDTGRFLQLVTADSSSALATAVPSALPVGTLSLSITPVMDDKLVVYPGYINTTTGTFSTGGSYTKQVDTGRRLVRIYQAAGTAVWPDEAVLNRHAKLRVRELEKQSPKASMLGFIVKKSAATRLQRWWSGHQRALMVGHREQQRERLEQSIATQIRDLTKSSRLKGVASYLVDEQGRVTHYLEINRSGDAFLWVEGQSHSVQGPAGADFVLRQGSSSVRDLAPIVWDDGAAVPYDSEVVKMARYVKG